MAKSLPAKASRELDKYKSRAAVASRKAREAPMKAATKGAQVSIGAAAAYGAARTQLDVLDNPIVEGVVALGLGVFGMWTGSATAVQAATGIACVTAHNVAEDMLTPSA